MSPLGIFSPRTGHQALFNELCRFHELDRKTRQLLQSVMDRFKPDKPSLVFVDSAWLRKAIESHDFSENIEELQELQRKWFGN